MDSLENELLLAKAEQEGQNAVTLDPTADQGFSTAKTNYGVLTFKVESLTAFGDGSKVVLSIGNLTSATINGGELNVSYGPRYQKGMVRWYSDSLKQQTVKFDKELRPGAWNNVTITLPARPPAQVGYMYIQVERLSRISLFRAGR